MNQYPIILAHGIARLDHLSLTFLQRLDSLLWDRSNVFDELHYFRGIASYLQNNGFEVYKTGVRFAANVEDRARDLRLEVERILQQSAAEKVHIVGHSMGGLDARHMIVDEGMANRVASLTTIGTPHLGTSFADWGLAHGGDNVIKTLHQIIDLEGFLTLTRAARQVFNERAEPQEAANEVYYQTYASSQKKTNVFGLLRLPWQIIFDQEGANDGLVSLRSQEWTGELVGDKVSKQVRQHHFPMPADHLNQIGWWDLEELIQPEWWKLNFIEEKRQFEKEIRQVYLKIANELSAL
jgi:triacylglycerol lipase